MSCWWCGGGQGSFYTSPNKVFPFIGAFYTLTITKVVPKLQRVISLLAAQKENSRNSCSSCQQMLHLLQEKRERHLCQESNEVLWYRHSITLMSVCMCHMHGLTPHCTILPKISTFWPRFSNRNWRVIFQVFQSNFGFGRLNSTVRCLVWENEQKSWEMLTSSLRLHILKSGNFVWIFSYCVEIK